MKVHALDHLVLTVADIAATCAFYERALGMEAFVFRAATGEDRYGLGFGSQKINLHQAGREFKPKAEKPTPGSADLCFLAVGEIAEWQAHFAELGLLIEEGPVQRSGATGPIMSLYIRDPDQNLIEVSVPI